MKDDMALVNEWIMVTFSLGNWKAVHVVLGNSELQHGLQVQL